MKGESMLYRENFTRDDVLDIIDEIHDEIIVRVRGFCLGENGLTEEDIDEYFSNYELGRKRDEVEYDNIK